MVRISVLVPIYNVERYLPACLDSLIGQTLEEIEIICINDGSTDSSPSIAERYASMDHRIKLIHKENTGYGDTMNVGLRAASGEYVGIVESDDFASLDMFESLYNKAVSSDADVVKSNFFEYRNGEDFRKELLSGMPYNVLLDKGDIRRLHMVTAQIWTAIYKRSFLEEHHIYFNPTPGASYQDTSFAFRVWFHTQKVVLAEEAYLHYRVDNPDSSVNSRGKLFCFCDEYNCIERFLKEHPHEKEIDYIENAIKFRDYLWTYSRIDGRYQYAFLLRMKKELDEAVKGQWLKENYFQTFPHVWEQIQRIQENCDGFFDVTAKYQDERIQELTSNADMYYRGFMREARDSAQVVIYGAGKIGKRVLEVLKCCGVGNIIAVAVSNCEGNPKELLDIPVQEVEQLQKEYKEALVVIAVGESAQMEIIKDLKKRGFTNIVVLDRKLRKYMESYQSQI